ncbi:MAG: hypothetical protein CMK09_02295 [Ponticaulis sp.]|nr:hypothetical protein [Ponticaulis sp.]|tara:strand:- start:46494 stop:47270 length:777 start_codon:yes stop_codon:yes gene_type:complete
MEDRVKPLKGVRNFRDFGGYATPTGRVRQGLLFRSGHYNEATDEDLEYLNGLNVGFHVDLRRPDERDRQPNKWPAEPVIMVATDGGREEVPAHIAALKQESVTSETIEDYMTNYYRSAPFKQHHIDLFTAWFDGLVETEGAAVVHCAAGKDRTGIICALTHLVLGVSEDDIFEDYDLTNRAVDIEAHLPAARDRFNAILGTNHEADVFRPFMGVRLPYLENAFDVMNEAHGSPLGYVRDQLGVTESKMEKIREKLIES